MASDLLCTTAAPLSALLGDGGIVRGYAIKEAIRAYLAHLQLARRNGSRWLDQKEAILISFRAWAANENVTMVEQLKPYHLSDFMEARTKEGDKPATLHNKAIVVRHLARWSLDMGHVRECEMAKLKIPAYHYNLPEIPPYATFLSFIKEEGDEERQALMTALLLTGLRRGELLAIRWQDVRLEAGYMHVRCTAKWTTKNKRDRTVPVCDILKDLLESRRSREDLAGPFLCKDGKPTTHPNRASAAFRAITRRADMEMRMHNLRHAFCTHVLQDLNADPLSVQMVMGHTTIRTTQLYMHPSPETPKRIAKLLDDSPALKP